MVSSSQHDTSRLPFLLRWSRRRAWCLTLVTHITACLKHCILRGVDIAMVEPWVEIGSWQDMEAREIAPPRTVCSQGPCMYTAIADRHLCLPL
jgi:hypothetical protein